MPDKWYLNLTPDDDNKNRGPTINLVAKRNVFHKPGATRRRVRWTMDRDLDGLDASLLPPRVCVLEEDENQELADRRFTNKVLAGAVTGVTYTVRARKAAGQGGNNVTFEKSYETRRKVFYDVVYMRGTKPHWDAVKARFKAAWAAVGYEFVENAVTEALLDEAHTDRTDVLLRRLYAGDPYDLPKAPFHVRLVVVKDICEVKDIETTWRMDRTTPKGTGITRVWSTGDTVHYESPIQLMAQDPTACSVRAIGRVAIPAQAITRPSPSTVRIDLTDGALAHPLAALVAGRKVSLKAKLVADTAKTVKVTLRLDHKAKDAPIQVGTATVTVAGAAANWTVTIHDDARTWAPAPVKSANLQGQKRAKFGDTRWHDDGAQDVAAAIVRQSDHDLVLAVPAAVSAPAVLAAATPADLEFSDNGVRSVRGLQLTLELFHDVARTESEVDAVVSAAAGSLVRYDAGAQRLEITDPERAFDAHAPLAAVAPLTDPVLFYAGADVAIPGVAIATTPDGKQVDFDLTNGALAAPLHAFQGGGSLEFTATLHARTSIGGYSPERDRQFVALTTRKSRDDEPAATTQLRLLMVALHELGHAHGLVPSSLEYGGGTNAGSTTTGGATVSNRWHYQDAHGGTGSHCSKSARLAPSGPSYGQLPTTSGQVYLHDGGGEKLCVMYHQLSIADMAPEFCESCKAALRMNALCRLLHTGART